MPNAASVKRTLSKITDRKELHAIQDYCKQRCKTLFEREEAAAAQAAWIRCKDLPAGTMIYCHTHGIFLGGAIQRGTALRIYCAAQPRAKRIWASVVKDGKESGVYWFGPAGIHRYDFQLTPPDNPVNERLAASLAKVTTDVLKNL
jgi:hypothetical protein